MKATIAWMLLLASLVLTAALTYASVKKGYEMSLYIEKNADQASASSDVDVRLAYMHAYKDGLKRYGLTEGNLSLMFPSQNNDLAVLNSRVDEIISRLEDLKTVAKTSDTYQNGMIDVRDSIDKLWSPTGAYLWIQNWALWWGIIILWILTLVVLTVAAVEY